MTTFFLIVVHLSGLGFVAMVVLSIDRCMKD